MGDLERWTAGDATSREKTLLRVARRGGPSAATRARIAASLGIAAGVGMTAPSAAAGSKLFGGILAKLTIGIGTLGLVTWGTWRALAPAAPVAASAPTDPTTVVSAAASSSAPVLAVETARPEPRGVSSVAPVPSGTMRALPRVVPKVEALVRSAPVDTAEAHVPVIASTPPPRSTIDAELALLEEARCQLGRGHGNEALATLATSEERHPNGMFSMERAVLRIEALAAVGRNAQAGREARAFLGRYPSSPPAARVRSFLRD